MKSNRIIALALVLSMAALSLSYTAQADYFSMNPNIRVGLIFGNGARESFETTAQNGFIIGEVRAGEPDIFYPSRFISNNRIAVRVRNQRLEIINPADNAVLHEHTHASNELAVIAALSPEVPGVMRELSANTTGLTTTPANNIYSGAFIYRRNANNLVEVINLVSLDDYIKGVIPVEVFASWETEALDAFAIAARSFAVHGIRRNRHAAHGFALCNNTHCQMFLGFSDRATDRTNAAVDNTRGLVMTFEGRVIEAVYHSSSGGATENHSDAWGGDFRYPFLASVQLPFENYNDPRRNNSRWTRSASPQELYEYLIGASPQAALFRGVINSPIAEIRINARSANNNRIRSVTVIDENGNSVTVNNSDRVRHTFARFASSANMDIFREGGTAGSLAAFASPAAGSPVNINISQAYVLSADGMARAPAGQLTVRSAHGDSAMHAGVTGGTGDFIFDGRGWGHGVGMSQWAMQDMALLGHRRNEILKTFYTGVSITRLDEVRR